MSSEDKRMWVYFLGCVLHACIALMESQWAIWLFVLLAMLCNFWFTSVINKE